MATGTPEQRPAVWARALLMSSLAFAGASAVLLAWF